MWPEEQKSCTSCRGTEMGITTENKVTAILKYDTVFFLAITWVVVSHRCSTLCYQKVMSDWCFRPRFCTSKAIQTWNYGIDKGWGFE